MKYRMVAVPVLVLFCVCSLTSDRKAARLARSSKVAIANSYGGGEEVEAVLESYSYHYFTGLWRFRLRVSWRAPPTGECFWVEGLLAVHKDGRQCSWQLERQSRNLRIDSGREPPLGKSEIKILPCATH